MSGRKSLSELVLLLEQDRQRITNNAAITAAATAAYEVCEEDTHAGHRNFKERIPGGQNIDRGISSWVQDYLGSDALYGPRQFRRRFRVPRRLFQRLHDDLLTAYTKRFGQRKSASGKLGHSSELKILVALRRLGTGRSFDDLDDSGRMGTERIRRAYSDFCECVVDYYGSHFLNRRPSTKEMREIEKKNAAVGFIGCIGCVDCCKVKWKNCPSALKGQFYNPKDSKLAVISVEAWCDRDLYVWHWFAGRAGTNNDKTMVAASPLFNDILTSSFPFKLSYRINDDDELRELPYFLVYGVYPEWPLFAKPIPMPENSAEQPYTIRQEAIRKDIERCFGVLQARFNLLRNGNKMWYLDRIIEEGQTFVIVHNMLVSMQKKGDFVEEENDEYGPVDILAEMLEENGSTTNEHRNGRHERRDEESEQGLGSEQFERFLYMHTHYTSAHGFGKLREGLVKSAGQSY